MSACINSLKILRFLFISGKAKATHAHTNRYLDFNSHHHTQHKHSVRTLVVSSKKIFHLPRGKHSCKPSAWYKPYPLTITQAIFLEVINPTRIVKQIPVQQTTMVSLFCHTPKVAQKKKCKRFKRFLNQSRT